MANLKVALVYDRVNKIGGAERVLQVLHEMFPEAPLYTSVYNRKTAQWADDFGIRTTFLQNIPLAKTNHEYFAWLAPIAFESLDFSEFNVVISVTSEYAKGIITKPKTLHICYCLTPTRYLWSGYNEYFPGELSKFISKPFVSYLRMWDKVASQRPDAYIAISENVKNRIKKYYGRESTVIYPPLTLRTEVALAGPAARFPRPMSSVGKASLRALGGGPPLASPASGSTRPYFLLVSRLVPYKRIDIAIEAFNKLGWPLKIVGSGREFNKLKDNAQSNIDFLQNLTDGQLIRYYEDCTALIFPGEEDLGLAILEAQSFGKPVVAYRGGGALETIVEGKTGVFFSPQTAEVLIKVLQKFDISKFEPNDCVKQAEKFSKERFKKEFRQTIERLFKEHKGE